MAFCSARSTDRVRSMFATGVRPESMRDVISLYWDGTLILPLLRVVWFVWDFGRGGSCVVGRGGDEWRGCMAAASASLFEFNGSSVDCWFTEETASITDWVCWRLVVDLAEVGRDWGLTWLTAGMIVSCSSQTDARRIGSWSFLPAELGRLDVGWCAVALESTFYKHKSPQVNEKKNLAPMTYRWLFRNRLSFSNELITVQRIRALVFVITIISASMTITSGFRQFTLDGRVSTFPKIILSR